MIAGENFSGHLPTKVVNQENAEIEDISVVRDGDHLFFLENREYGSMSKCDLNSSTVNVMTC